MASEQFSLCWDNFHKNMSSGLNGLLESEELVDVTLAVEGKCLKAHKMVLSVCSPYFKELFKTNPCQHPIVFMKDVSYVAISDLLQFMYQGEVQVSQDNLTTFIKTAEALQIKGLTGDGNGSADAETDSTHDVKSTASSGRQHAAEPEYKPRPKKQPVPSPISVPPPITSKAPKRPRLSVSSNDSQSNPSVPSTITKTEPISILPETNASATSAGGGAPLQQFKVEPYDQNQSVTIPDDGDDNFGDDTLDDTTVDDTEDYSMMEGEETEPQAGTSADGTGEGQDKDTNKSGSATRKGKRSRIPTKRYEEVLLTPKKSIAARPSTSPQGKNNLLEPQIDIVVKDHPLDTSSVLKSPKSSKKDSRASRSKEDLKDPKYQKPFKFGWKRELVWRSICNSGKRVGDVYYYTPTGKKVRSFREVALNLDTKNLDVDNFSFAKESLALNDPEKEIIRNAKMTKSDNNFSDSFFLEDFEPKKAEIKKPKKQLFTFVPDDFP